MKKLSLCAYWSILIIVIAFSVYRSHWKTPDKVFHDDINHYYSYLPATFIHHDLSLNFIKKDINEFAKHYWPIVGPKGDWVIVTTMGLSILYAPFFLIIHYPLEWTGQSSLGFTEPYQLALILSSLFYVAIGLHLLRKILLAHFSQTTTAITIIGVVLATNLLYYVVDEPAMSHAYNFALITAFVYFTMKWHKSPGIAVSIWLGLLAGLITLIRPTNVLVIVVFAFWGITSLKDLNAKFSLFYRKYYLVLFMVIAAFFIWLPQFIYWKYTTGQYLFFSYGDKGKFFFTNPQILNTLFSYRKGWFLYTPIMITAIAGLYFLFRRHRGVFIPVLIFMVANIWVISSWWLWWYGGSYGLRAYIDSYSIAALPFAALVSWAFDNRKKWIQVVTLILLSAFIFHNFFQIEQYRRGAIDYVSMTREAYWESFGKIKPSERFYHLLSYPDYKSAEKGIYPDPVIDPLYTGKLTRKEGIERMKEHISSSPEYLEMIRKKSAEQGISFDSMLYLDARYIYDLKVSEGTIKPSDP